MVSSIFMLTLVHLMYSWISSDIEVKPRVGQKTSLIHISPVAMIADFILGHQLDQLVPVRTGMDAMV